MKKTIRKNRGNYCCASDVGKVRISNEDQTRVVVNANGDILLLVCDGLGGHNKGDYASKIVADLISHEFRNKSSFSSRFALKRWMRLIADKANKKIFNYANNNEQYKGMATTLVAAVLRNDKLLILNSGDSRVYLLKDGVLKAMTNDQTYVNYLYRTGKITEEEMKNHPKKNVLMNAIGLYPSPSVEMSFTEYYGQTIILCSDGLYNNITDNEMIAILETDDSVQQKCESLIAVANGNGGTDNIAIALWENNDD